MQNHLGTFRACFATLTAAVFLALALSSCAVTVALPGGGSTTAPITPPTTTGTGTNSGLPETPKPEPTQPKPSEPTTGDDGENGKKPNPTDKNPTEGTDDPKPDPGEPKDPSKSETEPNPPEPGDDMDVPQGYDATWKLDGNTLVLNTYTVPSSSDLNVKLPTGGKYKIGDSVFAGQGQAGRIAGIIIPDAVIGIGNYAFQGSWVRQVEIPKSVTQIGTSAFDGAKLKKVTIQGSYEKGTLGTKLFANCDELAEVVFEAPVESLPSGIFEFVAISEIEPLKIILPQGLKEIESHAFYYANVNSLFIPATVDKIDESAFDGAYIETVYFGGDNKTWNKITDNGAIYISDNVQYNQIPSSILSLEPAVEFLEELFSIFL